jgi:hypothetical protein
MQPDDQQEYLRSILGQRPFKKTYKFFDGGYTVCFKTISLLESRLLDRLEDKLTELEGTDDDDVSALRLRFYCEELNKETLPELDASEDLSALRQNLRDRFLRLDSTLFKLLVKAHNSFIDLLNTFQRDGLSETF